MTIEKPKTPRYLKLDITEQRNERELADALDEIDRVVVILDRRGEYRWRRVSAGNFENIAVCGEGYDDPDWAMTMALRCNAFPYLLTTVAQAGRVWLVTLHEDQA